MHPTRVVLASWNMSIPTVPAQRRADNKVVLISGAAQGMGASHAQVLASAGAKVIIGDLQVEAGQALADSINESIGAEVAAFTPLDVTDMDQWNDAVDVAEKTFGRLDALINNAGIFSAGSVEDASAEDWNKTINIDLTGTFLGMKAAVPLLARNPTSSIINVSSIAGLVGFKHRAAYSAAKWGVQGLTKTSAMDLGPKGIRVNSVHPGSVKTPLTAGLKRGIGQIPAGRVAEVEEISSLILYLVSDESSFITGANIAIDGGETAGNNLRQDS